MLGVLPMDGIPASWQAKFGVQGMHTWARLLRDTRTKNGWPTLFADQDRLRTGLEMVQTTASGPRWGGRGGLRSLYADFLAESATLTGTETLNQSAAACRDLASLWDDFIDAIDPGVATDERNEQFAAMADRLYALAVEEEQAALDLRAALS